MFEVFRSLEIERVSSALRLPRNMADGGGGNNAPGLLAGRPRQEGRSTAEGSFDGGTSPLEGHRDQEGRSTAQGSGEGGASPLAGLCGQEGRVSAEGGGGGGGDCDASELEGLCGPEEDGGAAKAEGTGTLRIKYSCSAEPKAARAERATPTCTRCFVLHPAPARNESSPFLTPIVVRVVFPRF